MSIGSCHIQAATSLGNESATPRHEECRSKIFGIGLSKTGTTSLNTALSLLGYKSLHYPPLYEIPVLLESYDALTDTSVACCFRELDVAYPRSKFICTVREKHGWLRSAEREFSNRDVTEEWKREVRRRMYGTTVWDPSLFSVAYDQHLIRVQTYFGNDSDRLLIIDFTQGSPWHVLCDFLERPVPTTAFPHDNQTL